METSELYTEMTGYCETSTGAHFYPDKPKFLIADIAHSLSMLCRYNGHCRHFYSVAEHSVLVSLLMEEFDLGDPFEGLMHDATEAYLSDIPAPFKQFLPDLVDFDEQLESKLRAEFGLPHPKTKGCKRADWIALFLEAYYLLPSRGKAFIDPEDLRKEAVYLAKEKGWHVAGLEPHRAESAWLMRYQELRQ